MSLEPITRAHVLQFRKSIEEKAKKEREDLIQQGVNLIYSKTAQYIQNNPYLTVWRVCVDTFNLYTDFQKKGIMEEVLNRVKELFPDFTISESEDVSYKYIFTLNQE